MCVRISNFLEGSPNGKLAAEADQKKKQKKTSRSVIHFLLFFAIFFIFFYLFSLGYRQCLRCG